MREKLLRLVDKFFPEKVEFSQGNKPVVSLTLKPVEAITIMNALKNEAKQMPGDLWFMEAYKTVYFQSTSQMTSEHFREINNEFFVERCRNIMMS